MAMASVGHKWALLLAHCSSTAVVMATAADNHLAISLGHVLAVTIPATLIGVLAGCTWSLKRGKDLDQDNEFIQRCRDPEFKALLIDGDQQDNQSEQTSEKRADYFQQVLWWLSLWPCLAMTSPAA